MDDVLLQEADEAARLIGLSRSRLFALAEAISCKASGRNRCCSAGTRSTRAVWNRRNNLCWTESRPRFSAQSSSLARVTQQGEVNWLGFGRRTVRHRWSRILVWCPERYFQLERDCKQCGMPDYLKSELGERAGQVLLKKAEANLPKASVDKPSDLVDGVSRERSRGPLSKLPRSHMVGVRAFSDSPIFRPVARSRPSAIPKRRAPTPGASGLDQWSGRCCQAVRK